MAAYLTELRRLVEHCNYGGTLDKMLQDRLVWGINRPRDLSRRDPLCSQSDKLLKSQRTIQIIPCNMFTLWSKNEMLRLPPIKVHMELNHCSVPMDVDTGASVSIMRT